MKRTLLEDVSVVLLRRGFVVKTLTRSCFDVVARKDQSIIFLKVLQDANAISEEYAVAMQRIAQYLAASPLIIAETDLKNGVVYSRHGVHTLNPRTLAQALDNDLPFVVSGRAGLTAQVAGEQLHRAREEQGFSLGALSRRIGVSKQMIVRYEQGSDVSVTKAMKLYDLFGPRVFRKIELFTTSLPEEELSGSAIASKYRDLGFDAADAKKAPFDVVAKKERDIIFTEIGDRQNPHLEALADLIRADSLVIFSKKKPKKRPALSRKDFLHFDDSDELLRFVREY